MANSTDDGRVVDHIVPRSDGLISASFRNMNWSIKRLFARNGRFNGTVAIAHVPRHQDVYPIEYGPLEKHALTGEGNFGCTSSCVQCVWTRFTALVTRCVHDVMNSDADLEATGPEGDFGVRVAKAHIRGSAPDNNLGAKGRKISAGAATYYQGVEKLTNTLSAIMQCLDVLRFRFGVGLEGGRKRALVAGDQETYDLMQQAIKSDLRECAWVIPCIGDWHFLLHVIDVIIRR